MLSAATYLLFTLAYDEAITQLFEYHGSILNASLLLPKGIELKLLDRINPQQGHVGAPIVGNYSDRFIPQLH